MTGFEPLVAAASLGLANLANEIIKSRSGKVFTFLDQDLTQAVKQAVFEASKKYVENYSERHGTLKVLGMRKPVELDSIYTTVQLLDEQGIHKFESLGDLEQTFRKERGRRLRVDTTARLDGIAVANEKQYLMILGAPGSGKSTFLRKLGLEALKSLQGKKGSLEYKSIPVLIELKKISGEQPDIRKIIADEFEICGFPKAEKFTKDALEKGKLLILLDGLDEVPSASLNQVVNAIQDFVDKYDKNRYIASCRTAASRHDFRRFTDVTISEFDDEQILKFINNWFRSKEDINAQTARNCWELLEQEENSAAKELAHTPLLLTFLCLVYDRSQNLPENRSSLYGKALRILLEEWASEKRILREEIYQGLNTELEEVLLSEVAYNGFVSDQLFFLKAEIVEQIKNFLSTNLNAPKQLSGENVLDAIAIQQGIFVERAEGIYSFSHLTLQEYLTAQYISDNQQIGLATEKYISSRRWREVFLLIAGLMKAGSGSDLLLLSINKMARSCVKTEKLKSLLLWAERTNFGSTDYSNVITKRALSFYCILFLNLERVQSKDHDYRATYTRALNLAHSISNHNLSGNTKDLASALSLASAGDFDFDYSHASLFFSKYPHAKNEQFSNAVQESLSLSRKDDIAGVCKSTEKRVKDIETAIEFAKRINEFTSQDHSKNYLAQKYLGNINEIANAVANNTTSDEVYRNAQRIRRIFSDIPTLGIMPGDFTNNLRRASNTANALTDLLEKLAEVGRFSKGDTEAMRESAISLADEIVDISREISSSVNNISADVEAAYSIANSLYQRLALVSHQNLTSSEEVTKKLTQSYVIAKSLVDELVSTIQSNAYSRAELEKAHNSAKNFLTSLISAREVARKYALGVKSAYGEVCKIGREIAHDISFSLASDTNRDIGLALAVGKVYTKAVDLNQIFDKLDYAISPSERESALELEHSRNRSLDLAIKLTRDPAVAVQLQQLQAKPLMPTRSSTVRQEFLQQIWEALLSVFELEETLLEISQQEIEEIENYLYITYLLICCKKASVRLSPKTWQQIESQILLPREQ